MAFRCQRDSYAREVRPAGQGTCCSERVQRCGARGRRMEGAPSWIQSGALRVGVGAYFRIPFYPVHHHSGLLPSRGAAHRRKQRQEGSAERFPSGTGRHPAFPRGRGTGTRPISLPSPPFPSQEALNSFLTQWEVSFFLSVSAVMNTVGN